MVKKALSDAVKNIKQCRANEYWVSQAVAFYREGLSHLCQGRVNVTIWLLTFFPLVYKIRYGIS